MQSLNQIAPIYTKSSPAEKFARDDFLFLPKQCNKCNKFIKGEYSAKT